MLENNTIGRIYGSQEQTYTAGVICAKVTRYAERIHHPETGELIRKKWMASIITIVFQGLI